MRTKIAVSLVTLLLAGGCTELSQMSSSFQHMVTTNVDRLTTRRLLDEPLWFDAPGQLGVEVDSFNGSVTIEVNEDLEYAIVQVDRRALHGYGRKQEALDSLSEIYYTAEVVTGELGPVLAIRLATTHQEPHFQRANVKIELPEADGLRVNTQNGNVVARNVRGRIDIVTNDGNVRFLTTHPMLESVSIINSNGDIDYRVRAESTGRIDCEADRGMVKSYTRRGSITIDPGTDHDTLSATLNDGTNPIYLRTSDGDIRVAVVEDPLTVGRFIIE